MRETFSTVFLYSHFPLARLLHIHKRTLDDIKIGKDIGIKADAEFLGQNIKGICNVRNTCK